MDYTAWKGTKHSCSDTYILLRDGSGTVVAGSLEGLGKEWADVSRGRKEWIFEFGKDRITTISAPRIAPKHRTELHITQEHPLNIAELEIILRGYEVSTQ